MIIQTSNKLYRVNYDKDFIIIIHALAGTTRAAPASSSLPLTGKGMMVL